MTSDVPPFVLQTIPWLTILVAVKKLFEVAEATIRPEVRSSISHWLKNLGPPQRSILDWPDTYIQVFDAIFGEDLRSRNAFVRSGLLSIGSASIVTIVWASLFPEQLSLLLNSARAPFYIGSLLLLLFSLNLLDDYAALVHTRWLLGRIKNQSITSTLGHFAIVVVNTYLIGTSVVLGMVGSQFVADLVGFRDYSLTGTLPSGETFTSWWGLPILVVLATPAALSFGIGFVEGDTPVPWPALGISLYSTFSIGIWAWLYFVSGVVIRIFYHVSARLMFLLRYLDVEHRPLAVLGLVSNIIITIAYWTALVLWLR